MRPPPKAPLHSPCPRVRQQCTPDASPPPLGGFTTPEREQAARTAAHNGYLRSLDIGQIRATDVLSRRDAATLLWNFAVCFG